MWAECCIDTAKIQSLSRQGKNTSRFGRNSHTSVQGPSTGGIGRLKHLGRVISRILSARVAPRRGSFICCDLTRSPDRFRSRDGPSQGPLFGLAPNGVYRAASLALGAVGSYPTFSPLPRPKSRRFVFCGTFRQPLSQVGCPRVSRGGPRVTRHRALWCSDFPPPAIAESDPPPFQGEWRVQDGGKF